MSKLEAEELRTVRKEDVISWYNTYIRSSSPKRRRLAIHVYGCNSDIAEAAKLQEQSWTAIDDVESLKVSSQFYPSLCWWKWDPICLVQFLHKIISEVQMAKLGHLLRPPHQAARASLYHSWYIHKHSLYRKATTLSNITLIGSIHLVWKGRGLWSMI